MSRRGRLARTASRGTTFDMLRRARRWATRRSRCCRWRRRRARRSCRQRSTSGRRAQPPRPCRSTGRGWSRRPAPRSRTDGRPRTSQGPTGRARERRTCRTPGTNRQPASFASELLEGRVDVVRAGGDLDPDDPDSPTHRPVLQDPSPDAGVGDRCSWKASHRPSVSRRKTIVSRSSVVTSCLRSARESRPGA